MILGSQRRNLRPVRARFDHSRGGAPLAAGAVNPAVRAESESAVRSFLPMMDGCSLGVKVFIPVSHGLSLSAATPCAGLPVKDCVARIDLRATCREVSVFG